MMNTLDDKNKNVVIITYWYYPDMSPVSAVIDKYVQAMKGNYMFHVIAVPSKVDFEPLNDPYVKVYYMQNFWINLRLLFEEKYERSGLYIYKLFIQLFRIRSAILSFVSDSYINKWIKKSALVLLEKISKTVSIDAIISMSGTDLFTHQAALEFKQKHNEMKWLTFFTDPVTFISDNYGVLQTGIFNNTKAKFLSEKYIYNHADTNILVEHIFNDAINKFGIAKDRAVRFNYVIEDLSGNVTYTQRPKDIRTRLMYAGSFYKDIRNPGNMLKILSKVDNIVVDLYLRTKNCLDVIDKYKSNKIFAHEGVGHNRYLQMIYNEYDILINVCNNCTNQSPSKFYELLSTGRPIINFYYFKDNIYELVNNYPLGMNVDINHFTAIDKIDTFCRQMKGKQMSFDEVSQLFSDYTIGSQRNRLIELLQ